MAREEGSEEGVELRSPVGVGERVADVALSVQAAPVSSVLTFTGLLLAVQAVLAFSILRWSWVTGEELAAMEPGVTFAVAIAWLPLRKWVLPLLQVAALLALRR